MIIRAFVFYMPPPLSRSEFKARVFTRDGHRCVVCSGPAVDAHHIMDRSLFPDGGYYPDNGASVCSLHHLDCEKTLISVEEIRRSAGITNIIVPPHFDPSIPYDKWGNPIRPDGRRDKGPIFELGNVQIALHDVLHLFGEDDPGIYRPYRKSGTV